MSFEADAEEMAPIIQAILDGKPETPQFPAAKAWLAYLLSMTESSLYREEIIRKSESLNIQVPPVTEIDWAFERLKARAWLWDAYVIESAKESGRDGDLAYSLSSRAKRILSKVMDCLSDHHEAHSRLQDWLSAHPPDSPFEEVRLAYTMFFNESTMPLAKIMEEMDRMDMNYGTAHLMGAAFLRLRKRGWLVIENEHSYGLTSEARRLMNTIIKSEQYWGKIDQDLEEWMFANPPPGYDSSDEDFEEYTFPEL